MTGKRDMADTLPEDQLFVGGVWRQGQGAPIVSRFPADQSLNRVLHGASVEDVEDAIIKAQHAVADPSWRGLKPHERATFLYRISEGIARNVDRISYIQTRDTGKTRTETSALAQSAAGTFRYFAAVLETGEEQITPSRGDYLTFSCHEPIGVIAAITPWNSPIASDAQKLAPALAAGNAVILKPASWSPLTGLELARIIEEAGLPSGLLSVLPGSGSIVGDLLVRHPAVGKVSFTGGTAVGKRIAVEAARKLMPVSLELGGKSATVVFDDADVDQAVAGVLFGIFSSTGQSCVAGSRLLVQRGISDRFVRRLVEATESLKIGDPFDAATQVAPLIHEDHRTAIEQAVALAREEGGRILTGGERPRGPAFEAGIYYRPTIIDNISNRSRTCREEIFGPVLTVVQFKDEAEAVALANDNPFGLALGLWTRDVWRARRVARSVQTGTVWVNTYKQFSVATPFGGVKDSGIGREKGKAGLRAYQQQKSLYLDTSEQPHPWAVLGAGGQSRIAI